MSEFLLWFPGMGGHISSAAVVVAVALLLLTGGGRGAFRTPLLVRSRAANDMAGFKEERELRTDLDIAGVNSTPGEKYPVLDRKQVNGRG